MQFSISVVHCNVQSHVFQCVQSSPSHFQFVSMHFQQFMKYFPFTACQISNMLQVTFLSVPLQCKLLAEADTPPTVRVCRWDPFQLRSRWRVRRNSSWNPMHHQRMYQKAAVGQFFGSRMQRSHVLVLPLHHQVPNPGVSPLRIKLSRPVTCAPQPQLQHRIALPFQFRNSRRTCEAFL